MATSMNIHYNVDIIIYFIYLIIEAKQSNAISKNHSKRVIIVSVAKADELLEPLTRGRKRIRYNVEDN